MREYSFFWGGANPLNNRLFEGSPPQENEKIIPPSRRVKAMQGIPLRNRCGRDTNCRPDVIRVRRLPAPAFDREDGDMWLSRSARVYGQTHMLLNKRQFVGLRQGGEHPNHAQVVLPRANEELVRGWVRSRSRLESGTRRLPF